MITAQMTRGLDYEYHEDTPNALTFWVGDAECRAEIDSDHNGTVEVSVYAQHSSLGQVVSHYNGACCKDAIEDAMSQAIELAKKEVGS